MKTLLRIAQLFAILATLAIILFGLVLIPAGMQFLTIVPALYAIIAVWLPAVKIGEILWERELDGIRANQS